MLTSETSISEPLGWTGEETGFSPGFQALDPTYVLAFYTPEGGAVEALTNGFHFAVTLDDANNVLAAPLDDMPAPSGTVVFYRRTPPRQEVDFVNLGKFSAETHEAIADRAMMIAAELRRDLLDVTAAPVIIGAGQVTYAGDAAGATVAAALDGLKAAVDGKAASDHNHAMAGLSDVTFGTLGSGVDGHKVTYDHGEGKFVLAASDVSAAALVAAINSELGGTAWQAGGEGGGTGDITNGSNVGSAGSPVFKAKSGTQLQFRNIRGQAGITVAQNDTFDTLDVSADQTYLDGIYLKDADLADVAASGDYGDLSNKPTLGDLAAKSTIATADIAAAAATNAKLANMTAGTIKGRQAGGGTGAPEDLTATQARAAIGLGNVDNTADSAKPISSAVQEALDAKADKAKVEVKTWSTNHTLIAADSGRVNDMDGSNNITVPENASDALPIGFYTIIRNGSGSGVSNINPENGEVTLDAPYGTRLVNQGDTAILIKMRTNRWSVTGTLEP